MANQKLKAKKKKARERASKIKVVKIREARRLEAKKQLEWEEQMEAESGITKRKLQPYVAPEKRKQWEEEKGVQIKKQLEHNAEVLKALEDQYLQEQAVKEGLNAELESEGHKSLEEKVKALGEKAQAEAMRKVEDES